MISPATVEARRAVCRDSCTEKCAAYLAGTINHADPHEKCPRQGWILAWGCRGPGCKQPSMGLGDAVAAIAQPIARVVDAAFGTKVAECGGCKKRREALNKLIPNL